MELPLPPPGYTTARFSLGTFFTKSVQTSSCFPDTRRTRRGKGQICLKEALEDMQREPVVKAGTSPSLAASVGAPAQRESLFQGCVRGCGYPGCVSWMLCLLHVWGAVSGALSTPNN